MACFVGMGCVTRLLPFVAAAGVHLTWGCHPVFTRFLQVNCGLSMLGLLLVNQLFAWVFLTVSSGVRRLLCVGGPSQESDGAVESRDPKEEWTALRYACVAGAYGVAPRAGPSRASRVLQL